MQHSCATKSFPICLLLILALPLFALADDSGSTGERVRPFRARAFFVSSQVMGDSNAEMRVAAECEFSFITPGPYPIPFGGTAGFWVEGQAESQSAIGAAASIEYLVWKDRVGVEVGGLFVNDLVKYEFESSLDDPVPAPPDEVPTSAVESGAVDGYMAALAVNYHFNPAPKYDVYAGPLLAPAINISGFEAVDVAKSVAVGLNAGLDYFVNDSAMLSLKLTFIDFGQIEIDDRVFVHQDGTTKIEGTDINLTGYVSSRFEAEDDLRFLAIMAGGGFSF